MKARAAKISASARCRLVEAAERVIRLYQAWDKPDQVARWRAKLGLIELPGDVFEPP
jgi:hypothetical protein